MSRFGLAYVPIPTPDEDYVSKALVVLTILYVSSYRSVHFSTAVLTIRRVLNIFVNLLTIEFG